MKHKAISGPAVDVDRATRTVVVYFSKFGNVDTDGDLMLPSAYTKTISERGRKGVDLIWHLSNHRSQPEYCLAKPTLEIDAVGLKGTSQFVDTAHAGDIIKLYDSGLINQHSVGFRTVKGEMRSTVQGGHYYEISEVKMYEGSTVLWGANPDTPTVEVKSEAELLQQLTSLSKALKTGTFTDELFKELEIHFADLEAVIKSRKTTEPPSVANAGTQPDADYDAFSERLKSQFSFN